MKFQFGFTNFRECYGESFEVSTDLAVRVMGLRQEGMTLSQATPQERLEGLDAAVRDTLKELGYSAAEIKGRETWVFYPFARGAANRKKAEISRWALKRISELSGELPMLADLIRTYERVNQLPPWKPKKLKSEGPNGRTEGGVDRGPGADFEGQSEDHSKAS